jgi:hypothetical protein
MPAGAGNQVESMKVFIRNTQTGWFYQEPSQWTPDQATASDLGQVARAVEQIFADRLENVEILLSYDEPRYDLVLAVPPSPSRGAPSEKRHATENGRHNKDSRAPIPRKKQPPM